MVSTKVVLEPLVANHSVQVNSPFDILSVPNGFISCIKYLDVQLTGAVAASVQVIVVGVLDTILLV